MTNGYDTWKTQTPEEYYGPPQEIHCIKCGAWFETYDDDLTMCQPCLEELSEYDG